MCSTVSKCLNILAKQKCTNDQSEFKVPGHLTTQLKIIISTTAVRMCIYLATDVPEGCHGVILVPQLYVLWLVKKEEHLVSLNGDVRERVMLDETH